MNSLLLVLFLLYSLIIVFIDNIYIILTILFLEFISIYLLKIKLNLKSIFIFLMFIFLFNFLLIDLITALLLCLRLFTMYLIVLIVINRIGINNIALTFSKIFHSKELYLIISIALSFVPILKDEILNLKKSLLAKGYSCNIFNILKNPKIFVATFFHNLFERVNELEKFLISSGWV